MNESDDFDAIAASLRRQFSPPPLDALADRIAQEAEAHEAERAPARARPEPRRGRWLPVAGASVLAAAALLLVLRPSTPATPPPAVTENPPPPQEVAPPTTSERAGLQLHDFLQQGDRLPRDPVAWTPEGPSEVCATDGPAPYLLPTDTVTLLGECGGASGHLCSDYGLPADRALWVEVASAQVILCVERPWTDPKPRLPEGSPYQVFSSQLGDFTIHEITPLAEPLATGALRI